MTRTFAIAALWVIVGATAIPFDNAQARSRRHVSYVDSYSYDSSGTQRHAYGWRDERADWQGGWTNGPSGQAWNEPRLRRRGSSDSGLDSMIASHAAANGVPLELARRVVARESGGNPRAVSKGNYGLMQIRLGTARAMGYTGSAAGLLDPDTNLTYAMKYLAGAHRAAGGNHGRAVALYARGYYYEAKRQGWSPYQAASGYGPDNSYAWSQTPRAARRAGWNGEWSGGWNDNGGRSERSRRRGPQTAWNAPSWNDPSWNDPSWGNRRNDPSWTGRPDAWQDRNAPRRKKRG